MLARTNTFTKCTKCMMGRHLNAGAVAPAATHPPVAAIPRTTTRAHRAFRVFSPAFIPCSNEEGRSGQAGPAWELPTPSCAHTSK